MRPTGPLHLGHLFGALDNWRKLQEENECFFMIADWHALMSEYEDTSRLPQYAIECAADWLASGIDPKKSTIFIQSHVPQHLELYMVFSNFVPLGWLERCPTYKEQLRELSSRNLHTYGFLGYHVLQAADILLYRASAVPVGKDQLPHLELTNDIAGKFNKTYGNTFKEIKPVLTKTSKLLGIDGRKMSKSYGNYVGINESAKDIFGKVMSVSDGLMYDYYELLTDEDVGDIKKDISSGELHPKKAKVGLAKAVVSQYYGEKRAEKEADDSAGEAGDSGLAENFGGLAAAGSAQRAVDADFADAPGKIGQ